MDVSGSTPNTKPQRSKGVAYKQTAIKVTSCLNNLTYYTQKCIEITIKWLKFPPEYLPQLDLSLCLTSSYGRDAGESSPFCGQRERVSKETVIPLNRDSGRLNNTFTLLHRNSLNVDRREATLFECLVCTQLH